eukprot:1160809-Pelagomonas_calceolata.AAC.3
MKVYTGRESTHIQPLMTKVLPPALRCPAYTLSRKSGTSTASNFPPFYSSWGYSSRSTLH